MSGFEMTPLRRRTLRGIGPVTPWALRRAGQTGRRGMMGQHETDHMVDDGVVDYGDNRGDLDHE
jgi:hypothetical protein